MLKGGIRLVSSFSASFACLYKNVQQSGFFLSAFTTRFQPPFTDVPINDSSWQQKAPVWMAEGVTSSSGLFLLKDARVRETDSVHYHASLYRTE